MDALYDRNHQNLIAQIRNTTQSRVQVYPDFAPTTLPKYHVTLSDILKIAPQNDIESLYSLQQQYRQADANRQVYAKANADRLNTQIEIEKLKLSNPLLPQEEVEKTYDTIKELKLRSLDQFDPQFVAKSVLINKDIETQQELRDQNLEKEARLVFSTVSQLPKNQRTPALASTDKKYWRTMTVPPPARTARKGKPEAKSAEAEASAGGGGGGGGGGGDDSAAVFGPPEETKLVAPQPQIYVPSVPVPPAPSKVSLPQQGGLQVGFVPAAPFYAPAALPAGPAADGRAAKMRKYAQGIVHLKNQQKYKREQLAALDRIIGEGGRLDAMDAGVGETELERIERIQRETFGPKAKRKLETDAAAIFGEEVGGGGGGGGGGGEGATTTTGKMTKAEAAAHARQIKAAKRQSGKEALAAPEAPREAPLDAPQMLMLGDA